MTVTRVKIKIKKIASLFQGRIENLGSRSEAPVGRGVWAVDLNGCSQSESMSFHKLSSPLQQPQLPNRNQGVVHGMRELVASHIPMCARSQWVNPDPKQEKPPAGRDSRWEIKMVFTQAPN